MLQKNINRLAVRCLIEDFGIVSPHPRLYPQSIPVFFQRGPSAT